MVILSHEDAVSKMAKIENIQRIMITSDVEQRLSNVGDITVYSDASIPMAEFSNVKYPFIVAASATNNKDFGPIDINFYKK